MKPTKSFRQGTCMKKKLSFVLLTVAVLLVALAAGPAFAGNHGDNVEKAKRAQAGLNEKVLPKKDVVGTSIGTKGEALVPRSTAPRLESPVYRRSKAISM